jgi:hypothetical protein
MYKITSKCMKSMSVYLKKIKAPPGSIKYIDD